jgi:glucose uptake protein
MFVLHSYPLAVAFCVITMLCWGSWANTQKLAGQRWRFELFYWDYVLGVVLLTTVIAFTLGNNGGPEGRGFLADVRQAAPECIGSAVLGGVVFNAANILLVAAIDIAGMAVAFPVGIGLALVLGVLVNYEGPGKANPLLLFAGVAFIVAAILLDALAYRRVPGQAKGVSAKGLILAIACGILMGFFYRFVARSMSSESRHFVTLDAGKMGPYAAVFFFSIGMLISNLVFNTLIMVRPFRGSPLRAADYLRGTASQHLVGVLGGAIWGVGNLFSFIAFGIAGPAISYGLGQGATLVAALWGVFVWREFRNAPRGTGLLLALMFAGYVIGLTLVIAARVG